MTEDMLLRNVIELCGYLGANVMHIRPARTAKGWRTPLQGDGVGYPDLTIVTAAGRLLFRELKSERGKLSPEQLNWLRELRFAGQDADVWRPADWPALVKRELCQERATWPARFSRGVE